MHASSFDETKAKTSTRALDVLYFPRKASSIHRAKMVSKCNREKERERESQRQSEERNVS